MKIFGFVPARMAASRFPGKPLHLICGRPPVGHRFLSAAGQVLNQRFCRC